MDSTRVCQLHSATRFMSLSHFWSINFSTIVRETVASFSFAFRRIFLPHPGGHTLQKVLRSQLFPVQFSALIFFFSVSCVTLPFSIFYYTHSSACAFHHILYVFVALFGAFEMQFPQKYFPSRVSKYAMTTRRWTMSTFRVLFVCSVWVFISLNSVRQLPWILWILEEQSW